MDFGQRFGFKPVKEILLIDTITKELRNRIWSKLYLHCFQHYKDQLSEQISHEKILENVWSHFCKFPLDELQNRSLSSNRKKNIDRVKNYVFESNEWYMPYIFMEYILNNIISVTEIVEVQNILNEILRQEGSVYILINKKLTKITSEQEIQSIEQALENTNPYSGVQQHLNQALQLMSDRKNPDYRNSIKESISAVEGICKIIVNKENVGFQAALAIIQAKHDLHTSLKEGFVKLYGYTSNGDGIRHAMLEEPNLTYIDAKFMLVACTNFINYLIEKSKNDT